MSTDKPMRLVSVSYRVPLLGAVVTETREVEAKGRTVGEALAARKARRAERKANEDLTGCDPW